MSNPLIRPVYPTDLRATGAIDALIAWHHVTFGDAKMVEDADDDANDEDGDGGDDSDKDDADDSDKDDDGDEDWKAKYEAQQKINRGLERKGKKDLARIKSLEVKPPAKKVADKDDDEKPDLDKIREDAKAEAAAELLNGRVEDKIEAKARAFADPEDAMAILLRTHDIEDFIDDGKLDVDAITEALGDLAEKKPHLLAKGKKFEGDGDGGVRPTKTPRPKSMGEALARHYGGK